MQLLSSSPHSVVQRLEVTPSNKGRVLQRTLLATKFPRNFMDTRNKRISPNATASPVSEGPHGARDQNSANDNLKDTIPSTYRLLGRKNSRVLIGQIYQCMFAEPIQSGHCMSV